MTVTASQMGNPLPSGIVTFLLTDVEASTERWENSPERMRLAVARHDELLRKESLDRSGHVFRTAGDACFAAFASPGRRSPPRSPRNVPWGKRISRLWA